MNDGENPRAAQRRPSADSHRDVSSPADSKGDPIAVEDLVGAPCIRRHKLSNHLDELDRAGRVRRDEAGQVVVPPGLRVTKDRDEVELDGRCFWTWCAYDILGIFGALKASGSALSPARAAGRSRFSSSAASR